MGGINKHAAGCESGDCCGPPPPPPDGTLTICVKGCFAAALNGRTVDALQSGIIVATGTTSGAGCVSFSLPPGSYDWTTNAPANYDGASGTATVTSSATTTVNVTLSPSSGYRCSCDNCYPGNCGGSRPYVIPPDYPTSITGDDGIGTFAMPLTATGGASILYEAVVDRPAALAYPLPFTYDGSCNLPDPGEADVPVRWRVYCLAGQWYIDGACWDGKTTTPEGSGCPSSSACYQPLGFGGVPPSIAYPFAGQTAGCIWTGFGTLGAPWGGLAFITPTTGPLAGSGTVGFTFGGGTGYAMPYQVYGASTTFSWTG